MTIADRWLLPDGVEELLPPRAEKLENLRRRILDLYSLWGYKLVIPPLIEYLESLLVGSGQDLELQTFKLTDQLTGRLMGVRADITPQVARIDAHCLKNPISLKGSTSLDKSSSLKNKNPFIDHQEKIPARLCYAGSVLHAKPADLLASRTLLQTGIELYGHRGVDSDVEVINVMLDTMAAAECGKVLVNLGHVDILSGLLNETGLSETLRQELFELFQRKDVTGLETFVGQYVLDESLANMLSQLIQLSGEAQILEKAKQVLRAAPASVLAGIDELEKIVVGVKAYHQDADFYFDLCEMHSYNYHTGVVFSVFKAGSGEELAQGGRYDHIGEVFGRARPATGFSTDLLKLSKLADLSLDSIDAIFAPSVNDPSLRVAVRTLRKQGRRIVSSLAGDDTKPADLDCSHQLVKKNEKWIVVGLILNEGDSIESD
ncbi:MAG: ATP phosphoribosyltransferase regulatory subunit [Pseudomonadales bacterium]|nr:ATP phosphoribosyltransferase regulatory subunit [Pseudomonadales bacterium]